MSSNEKLIKQIVATRHKPDMTRKVFLKHHFQVHSKMSDSLEDSDIKPHGSLNANQPWFGRDDFTELYFRDWTHLKSVFTFEHVKTQVDPDGLNFSDIEVSLPLMAREKSLPLQIRGMNYGNGQFPKEGKRVVAMLWLSGSEELEDRAQLERPLSTKLTKALEANAASEVWGLSVNIGIQPEGIDLAAYFGGSRMPTYHHVYKILLKNRDPVTTVRKAQAVFYENSQDELNLSESFVVFGVEELKMDIETSTRFDSSRQPETPDL